MNKVILFLSFLLFSSVLLSCSTIDEEELAEGRCKFNADCKQGYQCTDSFCEDIYFPRKEIKTY